MERNYDDTLVHGSAIILSKRLIKRFSLPEELTYFITMGEFNKFFRYITYGIERQKALDEIMEDIKAFNEYTHVALPSDLPVWVSANFNSMIDFTIGQKDDD